MQKQKEQETQKNTDRWMVLLRENEVRRSGCCGNLRWEVVGWGREREVRIYMVAREKVGWGQKEKDGSSSTGGRNAGRWVGWLRMRDQRGGLG